MRAQRAAVAAHNIFVAYNTLHYTTFRMSGRSYLCDLWFSLKHFDTKIIYTIYDAYVRICVLSNANFNVPYLSLRKRFSPEILRVI